MNTDKHTCAKPKKKKPLFGLGPILRQTCDDEGHENAEELSVLQRSKVLPMAGCNPAGPVSQQC